MELEIQNLSKKFKTKKILNEINLTFNTNKIYGLLGLNGVGKTTLIKCIFNELQIDKGHILINNKNISFDDYKSMFYFPENDDIPQNISIYEYLKKIYLFSGQNKTDFTMQLKDKAILLQEINLKKTQINSLSSGQKKIVTLVACLLVKPKIIIFDEPTANLDIANKETLLNAIRKLKNSETIIILVTHLIEEVKHYLDHIIILGNEGILVNQIVPKKDLKKIYLQAINYSSNKLYK